MNPTVIIVADCPSCAGRLSLTNSSVPTGSDGVAVLTCCECDACWSLALQLRRMGGTESSAHAAARKRRQPAAHWAVAA